MKLTKYSSYILMLLCIAAFIILTVCFAPQAESVGVLLFFMVLWFPSLAVIAVTELIQIIFDRKSPQKVQQNAVPQKSYIEVIGLFIAAGASFLMSGFFLLMVLQGGNKVFTMANTVIGVNLTALLLLWGKIKCSGLKRRKG